MTGRGSVPAHAGRFDPGLQPERTELAWRRTNLALAVGAIVALRILPPVLGVWSVAFALAGCLVTAAMWLLADRRVRRTREALLRGGPPPPGGALMLVLAATTSVGAALGILFASLG